MMVRSFLNAVLRDGRRIGLVDVGASGGLETRWRRHAQLVTPFFFEPDHRALAGLQTGSDASARIYNFALAEKDGSAVLNLCAKQTVSSILKPNFNYLTRFPDVHRFTVVGQVEVPTRALDSCISPDEAVAIDFLKIDTQGSELSILRGARRVLSTPVIGLEVEAEFQELYEKQPLFGELSEELRKHGFELADFTSICRWNRKGFSRFGQLAFADALYLRPPETFARLLDAYPENTRREKCLKYIAICALYGRVDTLNVALEQFRSFLTPADLRLTRKYTRLLAIRDGVISKIFGVLFRVIFRPLGFNFLPVPYEKPTL